MNGITLETKLRDIYALPEMKPYARYMIYTPGEDPETSWHAELTVGGLEKIGWRPGGILAGLEFFADAMENGRVRQYFLYPGTEDPYKKDVNLIHISPAAPDKSRPVMLLCAGGGYQSVCTLVESLPTAQHMSEAGCEVFLLTYRVRIPEAAIKALNDLAAAVKWLTDRSGELGLDPARLCVGGWSAGANLISNWGCSNIGWKRFGAVKPLCLFPIYTVIDVKAEARRDDKGGFAGVMLGEAWRKRLDEYNVAEHIDRDYPPCYIVCGKDDRTVPPVNSELMKQLLDAAGVPAVLEEGEHAFHGFGDGTGTDVEGWPGRALAFAESLSGENK